MSFDKIDIRNEGLPSTVVFADENGNSANEISGIYEEGFSICHKTGSVYVAMENVGDLIKALKFIESKLPEPSPVSEVMP